MQQSHTHINHLSYNVNIYARLPKKKKKRKEKDLASILDFLRNACKTTQQAHSNQM